MLLASSLTLLYTGRNKQKKEQELAKRDQLTIQYVTYQGATWSVLNLENIS